MKIAFLGLGSMGIAMARNLAKAGHEVRVWNRTQARSNEVPNAQPAATPAQAVRNAEVVFTMLADDAAVESVVFDPDGFLGSLRNGGIHVSSSTISVNLSRRLKKTHEEHGQHYVSAPVFGRPAAAEAGKLFVVVGGSDEALTKCTPLLDAIGQQTFSMGADPVSATAVKLGGNFMIASIIESFAEAIALTRKHNVEPQTFVDFLTGTLFAAPIFKTYGGLVASQTFEPAGFKLRLGLKDIRLALSAAESSNVPMPLANLLRDSAVTAVDAGMGEMDWTSLSTTALKNAGLK